MRGKGIAAIVLIGNERRCSMPIALSFDPPSDSLIVEEEQAANIVTRLMLWLASWFGQTRAKLAL